MFRAADANQHRMTRQQRHEAPPSPWFIPLPPGLIENFAKVCGMSIFWGWGRAKFGRGGGVVATAPVPFPEALLHGH